MLCRSCWDTSEPSEIPSSTSTAWARIGGMWSGMPAIAAMPTAIMAPEISPPGRLPNKNSAPPALPIASVSSTLRVLARLGMAEAIDAGMRLTPPYGKSRQRGQMRPRDRSNARPGMPLMASSSGSARSFAGACPGQWQEPRSFLRLGSGVLLAFRHEFLALLAVDSLGIGFLGAFERRGGARLRGLLFRRRGFRRRCGGGRLWRGLREGGAHQQQGREGGRCDAGRYGHHGSTSG